MTSVSSNISRQFSSAAYKVGRDKGLISTEIMQLKRDARREFLALNRVPHKRLAWLTILIGAKVVNRGPQSQVVAPMLDEFRRKFVSRCGWGLPGIRVRGVFEIDILHRFQAGDKTHKQAALNAMGVDVSLVRSDQRILVPHLHAVVDLRQFSRKHFTNCLTVEFPGSWRVLAKPLLQDGTVRENLTNLASYSSKLKVAYSDSAPDRATRFDNLYEPEWKNALQEMIEGVGLPSLLFRHGGRKGRSRQSGA